jgi:hypothetical protein
MGKLVGTIIIFFCIAILFVAGCTNPESRNATPVETPTPEIVYVTVFVTPTGVAPGLPVVTSDTSVPPLNEDLEKDEAFIDYVDGNQIFEAMTALEKVGAGSYSINSGYNAESRKESLRLTTLLINASMPASQKVKAYRSAMMDGLSEMDGSTAGFTRYRDAMQTVILARNAALFEMHAAGSSSVDAIHLSGHGNSIRSFNTTETGMKTFTMHHTGDRNFAITIKEEVTGKYIALLVNEVGEYYGKKPENLKAGNYTLDITADGSWTVGIA